MKILFANIGWMSHYQGITESDKIKGGGSYYPEGKHEAYNFMSINGICYGYVEPPRHSKINLPKIDSNCGQTADKIKDVLIIWVSTHPQNKGAYIVGWYRNATVYSCFHDIDEEKRKCHPYNITATAKDCMLLPVDKRRFQVPRMRKGFLGRANVWYADSSLPEVKKFKKEVIDYITNYKDWNNIGSIKKLLAVNAEQRKRIERAAVEYVKKEYKKRGYNVVSREKDNCGWDLDAKRDRVLLKLEVKGLGGEGIIHITYNEYEKMNQDRDNYRLCVVFNAIKSPQLVVFIWDYALEKWVTELDQSIILDIETRESYVARMVETGK